MGLIEDLRRTYRGVKKEYKRYNTPRRSTRAAVKIARRLKEGQPYPRGHKYYGLVKGDEDSGRW
jgi:hypothetical protein